MVLKSEPEAEPRYMLASEVAHELRCSVATVRNLVFDGLLEGVKLNHRKNAALRITRSSFESYCKRIETEFAARIGGAA